MQPGLLPLFPLPLVLFPRIPLPLHIFEDRYKQLIGEVLAGKEEFGIVLAREDGILNVGCTAVVERVMQRFPDGQMDIVTGGRRRFELLEVNDEMPYLRGRVEFFDDEEPEETPGAGLRKRALAAYTTLRELETNVPDPAFEDPQLSFQLAQVVEDVAFRQRLLGIRSETQRLEEFVRFVERYLPRQRMVAALKRVQPSNGHSRGRFSENE